MIQNCQSGDLESFDVLSLREHINIHDFFHSFKQSLVFICLITALAPWVYV